MGIQGGKSGNTKRISGQSKERPESQGRSTQKEVKMSDSEEITDPNYRKKVKRKRGINDSYENENLKKGNFENDLSKKDKEKNETEDVSKTNKEKGKNQVIPNKESNKDDIHINHDKNVEETKVEDDLEKDAAKSEEASTNNKRIP